MGLNRQGRIRGLVGAGGAGGLRTGPDDAWSLVVHFAAYRVDGVLQRVPLRCEAPMPRDAMREWMARLAPWTTLEADLVAPTRDGVAHLANLRAGGDEDAELAAIRTALLQPVTVDTARFGTLLLDRASGHYVGTASWCGAPVRLTLACADPEQPAAALAAAESLFDLEQPWNARALDFAAAQLLATKNGAWLAEDEAALTREQFIACMALVDISVDACGDFFFLYEDGDLFWGHAIVVRGRLDSGLSDADIAG